MPTKTHPPELATGVFASTPDVAAHSYRMQVVSVPVTVLSGSEVIYHAVAQERCQARSTQQGRHAEYAFQPPSEYQVAPYLPPNRARVR